MIGVTELTDMINLLSKIWDIGDEYQFVFSNAAHFINHLGNGQFFLLPVAHIL